MRGKRGRKRCFGASVGGVSVRRIPNRRRDLAGTVEFTAVFICGERSSPSRFAKNSFGGGFSASLSGSSGVVENQDASVAEGDFLGLPCRALVEAVQIGDRRIPGAVEPVKVGFVIGNAPAAARRRIMKNKIRRRILQSAWPERSVGNPYFDRLPGWLDRLHGVDVEI